MDGSYWPTCAAPLGAPSRSELGHWASSPTSPIGRPRGALGAMKSDIPWHSPWKSWHGLVKLYRMIGNYYLLYELIQNVPKTEDLYGNLQKRWSNWCTRAPPRLYLVPGLTLLGAPPTLFMAHGKQLRPWNASRQLFLWTALSYGFPIVFSPNGEFMWMLLITKRHYFTILKTVLQRIHWVIQGEQHDSIVTFSKIYCKDIGSSSKDLKSGWYPVTYHLTIVFIIGTMSLVKTC